MTGTGREVMEQLRRSPTRRTVAVSLLDNEQGVAAEIVFQRVAAFLPRLMEQNRQDNLKKIVSALLPDVALTRGRDGAVRACSSMPNRRS